MSGCVSFDVAPKVYTHYFTNVVKVPAHIADAAMKVTSDKQNVTTSDRFFFSLVQLVIICAR
jgi:hypothetical protein